MNLAEKQSEVTALTEEFRGAAASFLVGYQGCKCSELTDLRRKLRPAGAKFSVVKNTLACRALEEAGIKGLDSHFIGPVGVIWSEKDPVTPAKVLTEFAKNVEAFKLKGGVVDGNVVSAPDVEALAKLPSKEQILANLLALINAPATRLLQTINAPASSLARLLGAWRAEIEKKGS